MRKFTTLLIGIIFLSISSQLFAQAPVGGAVYGVISESTGDNAVEYANITAFLAKDSSLITGTITDVDGRFFIQELPMDSMWLEIEFVGFAKHTTEVFTLDVNNPYKGFEEIVLNPAVNMLGEVNVEAEVKHVEYQIDKKIINPTKDIVAAGGTAVDVLKNVPSVQTDLDGNVSIRGNSGFKLLIDGRPSIITGSDGLKTIPAENIERIEIITNPSARYEADGVAGIINVILKAEKRKGINGMVSLNGGKVLDTYNTSNNLIFNIRREKINFFIGANYSIRNHPGSGDLLQETTLPMDSLLRISTDFNSVWKSKNYSFRAGTDITLSDKDLLTISGSIGKWGYGNITSSNNTFEALSLINSNLYTYTYDQTTTMDLFNNYYTANIDYQHKFKKEGHEINLLGTYDIGEFERYNDYIVGYSDDYLTANNINNFGNNVIELSDNSRGQFELNYINPIWKGKLEAGYKLNMFNSSGMYDYYNILTPDGETIAIDSAKLNPLDSYENIQSLYSTYSGEVLKFGYKLGLRMEYTDRLYTKTITGTEFGNKDLSFFPTVHISRNINESNQLFASYSRRITRPHPWHLDPQTTIVGLSMIRMGNPELQPEFTDSYELGYSIFKGMNYLSLEAFYRKTNNKISQISYLSDTSYMVSVTTFDNIDKDYSTGLEAMLNIKLFKAITFATGGSVYYYAIQGTTGSETISKETYNYNAWLNLSYTYPKTKTKLQVSGYFSGPRVELYSTSKSFYTLSAALKQDFLKSKLSVTFGCDNIVHSKYWVSETINGSLYSNTNYMIAGFRLKLGVTYRINDYKPRKDKTNEGGQEGGGGMPMM